MRAIRATFDGKAFVPEKPVNLPPKSPAVVLVNSDDESAQAKYGEAIKQYYLKMGARADDDWPEASERDSKGAWEED